MQLGIKNTLVNFGVSLVGFSSGPSNIAYDSGGGVLLTESSDIIPYSWAHGRLDVATVTFKSTLSSIGDYAFLQSGLTSIVIPDSVTSLGIFAFFSCTSLTSAIIGSGVAIIGDETFASCSSLTSLTIGSGVAIIGFRSFQNCSSLTSVTIPDSVTSISIGSFAFFGCSSLTSVTIPNNVTSIGDTAFANTGLTTVTIGNGVTSIGNDAFALCTGLTSVTIPNNVTSIGAGLFSECFNLNTLNCYVTKTIIDQTDTLYSTATPFTIYARATDATWTAGADTIGGKSVTVVKNL